MLKTVIVVCAIGLAATASLYAAETIQVEKLSKDELQKALQEAPDDTVIEIRGQSKTKAQWRSEWQAAVKLALERHKEAAAAAEAKFDAAAKALEDEQDKAIAEENARVDAEFEQLKSQ